MNKLLELPEFHFLKYKYSYKGKTAIRIVFSWYPEKVPEKKKDDDIGAKTAELLSKYPRENKSVISVDGKTEQIDEVPGFPGWKFSKFFTPDNSQDDTETGEDPNWEDNLPF